MDMSKYVTRRKEWLNTEKMMEKGISELNPVITDVREQMFEDDGKLKPVLDLINNDEEFSWALNVTNLNTLIDMFGVESKSWIGKAVMIKLDKTDYQGKRVPCLRVV
jgi:hypothetical protein